MLRSTSDTRHQKPKARTIARALKLKKDKSDNHTQMPCVPSRAESLSSLVTPSHYQQPLKPEERWTVVENYSYPSLRNAQQNGIVVEITTPSPAHTHAKKGSWSPSFQVIPEVREPQDEAGNNQMQRNGQSTQKGTTSPDITNNESETELFFNLAADPSPATAFLIREIQRLANHDFNHHGKPAPFPQELQGIFQKLCDLSVCLRSARKNARNSPFAKNAHAFGNCYSPSNGGTSPRASRSRTCSVTSSSKRPFEPFVGGNSSTGSNPAAATAAAVPTGTLHKQQQDIIQDLEHQLAQSRKAHYDLLQAHITNVTRQFSPLSSPATVSTESLSGSVEIGGDSQCDFGDPDRRGLLAKMLSESQILESMIYQQQQQQQQQQQRLTPSLTDGESMASSLAASAQEMLVTGGSALKLSMLGREAEFNQLALKQVMKRLLEAQKELGMLKMMMMMQSHGDVQDLEEEILHKEEQLKRHYDLFHSLVMSQQIGLQIKISQGSERIKQLQTQIEQFAKGHELLSVVDPQQELVTQASQLLPSPLLLLPPTDITANVDPNQDQVAPLQALVAKLEADVAANESTVKALQTDLARAEASASEAQAKCVALTQELEVERKKTETSLEEGMDIMEHMTKEHKKKTTELSSHLRKSRQEVRKYQQESQQMALKIVRLQNLNEELQVKTGHDKLYIQSLLESVQECKQTIDRLQQGGHDGADRTNGCGCCSGIEEGQHAREIASLETKIEELELLLRAKDTELEQSLEAAERVTLRLEEMETRFSQELAAQQKQHQQALQRLSEETQVQSQLERKLVGQSVALYEGMATRLERELSETQEKLRETMLCWGHTKEQCMRYEASYRKKKRELEETTKSLQEVHVTLARLGDAIGLLEHEKEVNQKLNEELQRKDGAMHELEQRLRQVEIDSRG